MPRTKLGADAYKDKDLAALIRRYKYGCQMTNEQLAAAIGVSVATLKRYLDDPKKMSVSTIRKIRKQLVIPKEEIMQLVI